MTIPDSKIAEIVRRHIDYFDIKWYKKIWAEQNMTILQGFKELSELEQHPYDKIVKDLIQEEINIKMEMIRQASEL